MMQDPKLSRAMAKVLNEPGVKGVLDATTRARIFDSAMTGGRVLSKTEVLRMAAQIDPEGTVVKGDG